MNPREVIERLQEDLDRDISEFSSEDLTQFEDFLGIDANHKTRDVILGLMAHFTPEQALAEQNEEEARTSRFETETEPYVMIEEYLIEEFEIEDRLAKNFSQQLGKLWGDWFTEGRYISYSDKITKKLRKDQQQRCANCHVKLEDEEGCKSYQEEDEFKPIHRFSEQQTEAELDHVEPLSQFGANDLRNLQVLCRFCNRGKSNSKHIPVLNQLDRAVGSVEDISQGYRRRVFFAVTAEYDSCQSCGSRNTELTIQMKNQDGCYIVSNLEPICVDCAYDYTSR